MAKYRKDKAWLLATARVVAEELKHHTDGTQLRIRIPSAAIVTKTDGWRANIGDLGKGRPVIQIWYDRITGAPDRKLYGCFRSEKRPPIMTITRRVSEKLWPVRTVEQAGIIEGECLVFKQRLRRSEFNAPILEKYDYGRTYYGIYDPTRDTADQINPYFVARVVAFFEDVARALPNANAKDDQHDIYPRTENRKRVASHLQRERSSLLATECKIRDNYTCQVCRFRFERRYGKLGSNFAEAHHLVPLAKLEGQTQTSLEDLTTVCANCHRMLHRMTGQRNDITKLKKAIQKNKQRRM